MFNEIFATTTYTTDVQIQLIINEVRASSNLVAESSLRLSIQAVVGERQA